MSESTAERWKPIPGHDGYEVSDQGRVRSLTRIVLCRDGREMRCKGKMLTPVARGNGHLWFQFRDGSRSIHSLVLEAFVGPRPEGMWGCHWDDDPTNNHLSNLRWARPVENAADMKRNSGHYLSNKTHCKRGHPLAGQNLTPSGLRSGKRTCLACVLAQGAAVSIRKNGGTPDVQALANAQYAEISSGNMPVKMAARTHCPRQHLLVAPNLVASNWAHGGRACLACSRASSAAQKARRRGEEIDFQAVSDARYAAIMSDTAAGDPRKWTTCKRGHSLDEPNRTNTARENGYRACLACAKAHSDMKRARKRGGEIDLRAASDLYYAEITNAQGAA